MTEQIFSSVRWPVELYGWIKDLAYKKHQSVNKTVIELVERARTDAP